MSTTILALSTALQYVAAFLALRLIRITRHRAAWLLVAAAVLLMGVRRTITLVSVLGSGDAEPDLAAETVALLISALMVVGVALIGPVFIELRRQSDEIERRRLQLQAILDHTPAVVYVRRLAGDYVLVNDRSAAIFGLRPADMVGRRLRDLLPEDKAAELEANDAQVLTERSPKEFDEVLEHHDGTVHHYLSVKFPLLDPEGKPYALCGISTDISERTRAQQERHEFEAKMLHAQKLESLGVLAGGIAHDFNNLLVAIIGGTHLALAHARRDPQLVEDLRGIEEAAAAASALCKQLLAYSGRGKREVTAVDVGALVQSASRLIGVSTSKKARLEIDMCPDLPLIEADGSQVLQVLMNLISNASDALGDRPGTIRVSARPVEIGPEGVADQRVGEPLAPGKYVAIEVEDDGEGMDVVAAQRLFEPFFSTKFTGRGLGLAAVDGIVRGHHGAIAVRSEPGHGTRFRVLLPVPDEPLQLPPARRPAVADAASGGTVLVVDDEKAVREIACRLLEHAGFEVLAAENGRTASELFAERGKEIDVVFLDLTMPEMDGAQTLARLRTLDPNVRVVVTSGYDEGSASRGALPHNGFVPKPYGVDEVVDAVRRALRDDATASAS